MSNLAGASIKSADLCDINAMHVNFNGCDFRGSLFLGAKLDMSDMSNADLRGATLDYRTSLVGTNLIGAKIDSTSKFIDSEGNERQLKYQDLANAQAAVDPIALITERTQETGQYMHNIGISADMPGREMVQQSGPSVIEVLMAGSQKAAEEKLADSPPRYEVAEASPGDLGNLSHNAQMSDEKAQQLANGGKDGGNGVA